MTYSFAVLVEHAMLDWIAWSTVYIATLLYGAMLDWITWSTVYIATLLFGSCELLGEISGEIVE